MFAMPQILISKTVYDCYGYDNDRLCKRAQKCQSVPHFLMLTYVFCTVTLISYFNVTQMFNRLMEKLYQFVK